jgi:hypothetical protein
MEKAAGEVNVPRELLNKGKDTVERGEAAILLRASEELLHKNNLSVYAFGYVVF